MLTLFSLIYEPWRLLFGGLSPETPRERPRLNPNLSACSHGCRCRACLRERPIPGPVPDGPQPVRGIYE